MKYWTGVLLFLIFGLGVASPQSGRLSPVDQTSYRHLIDARKGRVVLIDFWATWCEPCRAEMPQLVSMAARYRARGLDLVTISCDEPEQEGGAAAFLSKHGVPGPRYIKHARNDDKFINSVDAKWSGALPALFLYDRRGKLVKSFVGETGMAALESALKPLL